VPIFSGRWIIGVGQRDIKTQQFVSGIALCIAVSAAAMALERLEVPLLGRIWFEALILAILLGG
jgi:uncharacterized membrane protein YadS